MYDRENIQTWTQLGESFSAILDGWKWMVESRRSKVEDSTLVLKNSTIFSYEIEYSIAAVRSMITAKKSRIIFFASGAIGLIFWRLIKRSDTTYLRQWDGADARFFGFTKMALTKTFFYIPEIHYFFD